MVMDATKRLRALCQQLRPQSGRVVAARKAVVVGGLARGQLGVSARPELCSTPGEKIEFHIEMPGCGGQVARWALTKDGYGAPFKNGVVRLDAMGRATCHGRLASPGFLQIRVSCADQETVAGAGVAPHAIAPSLPPPEDFDDFWAHKKALLASTPLHARLTPVPAQLQRDGVDTFDVQADSCVGAGVSAYFSRPAGAAARSLPAILIVHGAGIYSSNLESSQDWAVGGGPGEVGNQVGQHTGEAPHGMARFRQQALAMDMNAHGIPNGQPESYYQSLGADGGALHEYNLRGRESRESTYFLGMLLRLVRAIDFLTDQPEWDQRTVAVFGVSQGGFQAIAAAGLDSRVTFFAAGVPAGCDHTGHLAAEPRISGWPKLAADGGEQQAAIDESARYFDCVNFASRAHAPSQFTVGFIDQACPPTSVYAAFNALPSLSGNKALSGHAIHYDAWAGHEHTPAADTVMRTAVLAHFDANGHHSQ